MGKAITFIINPAAGFGKTRKKIRALVKEIRSQQNDASIMLTHHAMHAINLTKQAIERGTQRIIVIGGDGTLNEVINGYFDQQGKALNPNTSIAIVPSGTGSDFSRGLGRNLDMPAAINHAITAKADLIDLGLVEARDAQGEKVHRHFINVSSLGLSGLVAGFMKNITKKLGARSAYFFSSLQAIRSFNPPTIIISDADGHKTTVNNCSLVSFANGKYFGSGMKIAPDAVLDDGLFDVVAINDLSTLFFLTHGYRVYQGTHTNLSNVSVMRHRECMVEALSKESIYVETDGELFAQLPAQFSIRHRVLPFVL